MVRALLWRGRGEPFASLAGLRLWFGLGRLLRFFSAFVFASHGCKCAIKGLPGGRQRGKFLFQISVPGQNPGAGLPFRVSIDSRL